MQKSRKTLGINKNIFSYLPYRPQTPISLNSFDMEEISAQQLLFDWGELIPDDIDSCLVDERKRGCYDRQDCGGFKTAKELLKEQESETQLFCKKRGMEE
ncbi:Uncharacterized protein QTN25_007662 [Entamoeba marina]